MGIPAIQSWSPRAARWISGPGPILLFHATHCFAVFFCWFHSGGTPLLCWRNSKSMTWTLASILRRRFALASMFVIDWLYALSMPCGTSGLELLLKDLKAPLTMMTDCPRPRICWPEFTSDSTTLISGRQWGWSASAGHEDDVGCDRPRGVAEPCVHWLHSLQLIACSDITCKIPRSSSDNAKGPQKFIKKNFSGSKLVTQHDSALHICEAQDVELRLFKVVHRPVRPWHRELRR